MDKNWGDVTYRVGDDVSIFTEGDSPFSLGRIIAIGKVCHPRLASGDRIDSVREKEWASGSEMERSLE